jgi:uncharacterized protein (TIGR02594 family)
MIFQVRGVADVLNTPELDPRNPSRILTALNAVDQDRLEQAGNTPDGNWIDVRNRDFDFPHMWVRAADIVEADLSKPLPIDLFTFVTLCTIVAEDFNSRQAAGAVGVSRDYLLALSVVLNGLERLGFTDEPLGSFDPFHFTESEWSKFCGDPALDVNQRQSFDRFDPLAQIDAAVALTFAAIKNTQSAPAPPDPAAGPYVPNSIDLFLTHMLGPAAGLAILKDRLSGVALTKPWSDYVNAAGGDPASLKTRYGRFLDPQFRDPQSPDARGKDSVADLSGLIESIFDSAYVVVSKIVSDALPQDVPPTQGQGSPDVDPPWMQAARAQLQDQVKRPDDRILDYFRIAKTQGATVETPWCGAFVAFCLDSAEIKIPQGGAEAGTWSRWGRPVSAPQGHIPLGAVVVVSHTPDTHKAGHVAFCAGDNGDPRHIQLLGGNQTSKHAVTLEPFPRSCILAIRWPTDPSVSPPDLSVLVPTGGGSPVGVVGDVAIGRFTADDWEKYCQVLGNRESTNNYAAVNRLGYCGRWQFGALALADCGYVRKGTPQGQLANPAFWTGKDGIRSRKDWLLQHQVQINAMLAYTRAHYSQLKRLGVVDSTSAKSDLAGYLAAAHLVGVGGAEDLHNGRLRSDANRVTSKQYFDLLSNAFKS